MPASSPKEATTARRRLPKPRPHGRVEVMSSLVEAAGILFAERGPASVSVRDIAEKARVNHGLIFRHFGSKEGLLKEVMRREAQAFSSATGESSDPLTSVNNLFAENIRRERFIRILAFAILSGTPIQDLYSEEGALGLLLQRVKDQPPTVSTPKALSGVAPHISVAAVSAFMKGWLLFEPWVLKAVGAADDDVDAIRRDVALLLGQIIVSSAPAPQSTITKRRPNARRSTKSSSA